jgi:ParB family chromosome partitioning protein
MARKGLLSMTGVDEEHLTPPAPPKTDIAPAIRRGPVGAMTNDLTAHSVREIDCERIIVDGINDRLTTDDEDIAALRASIEAHGQQVPIMVRPIAERPGFFRMVYGRRRLAAMRPLGIKIKALIRTLSDIDAILAQGQENNVRRDPSFIEKALFAKALQDEDIDSSVIHAALNIDRQIRSKMKLITDRIPFEIIAAIGSAPEVGRRRWAALADVISDNAKGIDRGLSAVSSADDKTSAERFDAFIKAAEKTADPVVRGRQAPAAVPVTLDNGQVVGAIARKRAALEIRIDTKDNTEFGQWVEENGVEILRRLHADWSARTDPSEQ